MDKYYSLLCQKKILNHKIALEKKRLHCEFVSLNKKLMRILDAGIILMIFFNVGALILTNMMVVKESPPEAVYMEINPGQAETHNLEVHPEASTLIPMILKQLIIWFTIAISYIYLRRTVYGNDVLFILILVVLLGNITWGWDFFNDFGYFIGEVLFN